jgi:hypothetical protein
LPDLASSFPSCPDAVSPTPREDEADDEEEEDDEEDVDMPETLAAASLSRGLLMT